MTPIFSKAVTQTNESRGLIAQIAASDSVALATRGLGAPVGHRLNSTFLLVGPALSQKTALSQKRLDSHSLRVAHYITDREKLDENHFARGCQSDACCLLPSPLSLPSTGEILNSPRLLRYRFRCCRRHNVREGGSSTLPHGVSEICCRGTQWANLDRIKALGPFTRAVPPLYFFGENHVSLFPSFSHRIPRRFRSPRARYHHGMRSIFR